MNHQVAHHVFVPVTDDLIYNHPEQIEGPLVPYFAGVECQNWLAIEINPDDNAKLGKADKRFKRTAKLRLAYSA